MSVIYRVQQKLINNYVNVSKTNQLCKHKHNTKKTCPAGIYLFKVYNKNTRTRCKRYSKVMISNYLWRALMDPLKNVNVLLK